jgi:uncharacterized protein involved in response to NO
MEFRNMPSADLDARSLIALPPETVLTRRGPHVFFVLAALYGAAVLVLWVLAYRLAWADRVPATMWHAHEMIYGFAAAGLAGVLAALVPSWSGALPCTDTRLIFLTSIWLLGRIAMVFAALLPHVLVAVLDLSFLPVFAALVVVPHIGGRPGRNLGLLLLLLVLWLGQTAMDAEAFGATFSLAERGARIGVDTYLVVIGAIGGYAIPAATNRFLASHDPGLRARSLGLLDALSVGLLILYLVSDAVAGMNRFTAIAALGAAIANGARFLLWQGHRTLKAPSLAVLHLGYFWMVAGLLLEAATPIAGGIVDMAAIHVLTAGAVGTTLMAVISRESLLHGRHGLSAGPTSLAAYALVSVSVVLRIAALFVPGAFVGLVIASGMIWAFGFLVLVAAYLPTRSGARA